MVRCSFECINTAPTALATSNLTTCPHLWRQWRRDAFTQAQQVMPSPQAEAEEQIPGVQGFNGFSTNAVDTAWPPAAATRQGGRAEIRCTHHSPELLALFDKCSVLVA